MLISTVAQAYKNVVDWLNPTAQSGIHEAALRRHEVGTGQWFLGSNTFRNWMTDPGTSLWLSGEGLKTIVFLFNLTVLI